MLRSEINAIRQPIEKAATDPLHCDAAVLMGIARDILGKVGKDYPSDEGFLQPTTTERGVLCEVAQVLLGDECQHSRVSWRMSGAQTALNAMDRLVQSEPEKRPITSETPIASITHYLTEAGQKWRLIAMTTAGCGGTIRLIGDSESKYAARCDIYKDDADGAEVKGLADGDWVWRTQYDTGNLDSFELLDELIKEQQEASAA
jgi:hypothetical protein